MRVEASKNRLIWVRPRRVVRFFSTCREMATASSERSSSASNPWGGCSTPSRWRWVAPGSEVAVHMGPKPICAARARQAASSRSEPQAPRRGMGQRPTGLNWCHIAPRHHDQEMATTGADVRARIDAKRPKSAPPMRWRGVGLSISDAIRLLMRRVADEQHLAFER